MLRRSFVPWVRIMRIHLMHHPRSRDGSSTFRTETPRDHPREEEEDHHHAPQDRPQEEEGVEAVEGHSHYPDTPCNQLKNF